MPKVDLLPDEKYIGWIIESSLFVEHWLGEVDLL